MKPESDAWVFVQRDLVKRSVWKEHVRDWSLESLLVRWWAAARVERERLCRNVKNGDLEGICGDFAVGWVQSPEDHLAGLRTASGG